MVGYHNKKIISSFLLSTLLLLIWKSIDKIVSWKRLQQPWANIPVPEWFITVARIFNAFIHSSHQSKHYISELSCNWKNDNWYDFAESIT